MKKQNTTPRGCGEARVLGRRTFAAISAVEGLRLTPEGKKRVQSKAPPEQRRAEIIRAYLSIKEPR